MVMNKMITLEGANELFNVFTHLSRKQGKIILWQNVQESNKRLRQNARIGLLNLSNQEMTLYPEKGVFAFQRHSLVYFFGLDRTTIFKASILYHSPLKLVIRLPRKVMMANGRGEDRKNFTDSNQLVRYTYHQQELKINYLYHHSRLIDVSSSGLAFKSSLHNVINFRRGDRLWISSPLNEEDLLEGEIRYVKELHNLGQEGHLRVGVKF